MNKIIKVYGHHRSGNNYLCALLWKNFYSGQKSTERMIERADRRFILFGEEIELERFLHPYVNIFGGHDSKKPTKDSIYIIRNYFDVEKSCKKMKHPVHVPDPFDHMHHVYTALQKRPYVVYYEDLKDDPEKVLCDIQHHFGLNRLFRHLVIDIGYCGWPE